MNLIILEFAINPEHYPSHKRLVRIDGKVKL